MTSTRRKLRRKNQFEQLERRCLLAADPVLQSEVLKTDPDGDGVFDTTITRFLYDSSGELLQKWVIQDFDDDGSIDFEPIEEFLDPETQELTRRTSSDQNGDRISDNLEVQRWNRDGQLVFHERSADFNFDGTLDELFRSEYDALGNQLLYQEHRDSKGDFGIDSIFQQEWRYSADGQQLVFLESFDDDADGVIDFVSREERYREDGELLLARQQQDEDRDGTLESLNETEVVIDEQGVKQQTDRSLEDFQGDGVGDANVIVTITNAAGVQLLRSIGRDYQSDGTVDVVLQLTENTETGQELRVLNARDENFDGKIDFFQETVYHSNGSVERFEERNDHDLDGINDVVFERLLTFTDSNQLLTEVATRFSPEAHYRDVDSYTYTPTGELRSRTISRDYGVDGGFEIVLLEEVNNDVGQRVRDAVREDFDLDGVPDRVFVKETSFYPAGGQLQTIDAEERDFNSNGKLDRIVTETNFREDGRVSTIVRIDDTDNDGQIDSIVTTLNSYRTVPLPDGESETLLMSRVVNHDYNADGETDFVSEEAHYDEQGRETLRITRRDRNGDGVAESSSRLTNTFDQNGRVTKDESFDGPEDGHPTNSREEAFALDGRPLRKITIRDRRGDGTPDSIQRLLYEYDADGRELSFVEDRDDNGDGVIDIASRIGYTYNPDNGRLAARVQTDEEGGILKFTAREELTYRQVDGAVSEEVATRVVTHLVEDRTLVVREERFNDQGQLLTSVTREDGNRDARADGFQSQSRTYAADGLTIESQAESRTRDLDRDGTLDLVTLTTTFYPSGSVAGLVEEVDYNNDGSVEYAISEQRFLEDGRELLRVDREDRDRDQMVDSARHYEKSYYESGGLKTESERLDTDGDGVIDFVPRDNEFDEEGRLLKEVRRRDSNGDNVADTFIFNEYTYNADGDRQRSVERAGEDRTGDGIVDVHVFFSEFSDDFQFVTSRRVWDYGNDGTVDFLEAEFITREDGGHEISGRRDFNYDGEPDESRERTFDGNMNDLLVVEIRDTDGDRIPDYRSTAENTYDEAGRLILSLTTVSSPQSNMITERRFDRDAAGNVVRNIDSIDHDADGTFDEIHTKENAYDDQGRELLRRTINDLDGDGRPEFVQSFVATFEGDVRRTFLNEVDFDGDGEVDFVAVEERRDSAGRLLYSARRDDDDRDGVLDQHREEVNSYNEAGDLIERIQRRDQNRDGEFDFIRTESYGYLEDRRLAASAVSVDEDGDGDFELQDLANNRFVVLDDAVGLVATLIGLVESESLRSLGEAARANLEVGTAVHDERAVANLRRFVAAANSDVDLSEVQRDDLISTAEQIILFINDSQLVGVDGDLNGDGNVDFEDFSILAENYGRSDETIKPSEGDLDGNGDVSFRDFLVFAHRFNAGND